MWCRKDAFWSPEEPDENEQDLEWEENCPALTPEELAEWVCDPEPDPEEGDFWIEKESEEDW